MEHQELERLRQVAEVHKEPVRTLTRLERLERWVGLLERDPTRRLNALPEIEYMLPSARALARVDNSPLTVAFEDPVLRAEGLESDRLGDVMNFFEISEHQAHRAFCSCLGGYTTEAAAFAQRLKDAAIGRGY